MRKFLSKINFYTAVPLTAMLFLSGGIKSQTTLTFSFTGSAQTWTVPSCVTQLSVQVWGAEGGGSSLSSNSSSGLGGKGGYAAGTLSVVPGNTIELYVGGFGASSTSGAAAGGFNGGGSGYASSSGEPGNGGGGASDIRINGQAFSNRAIVAGGGGGGGEDSGDSYGNGGGTTGTGYAAYDATQTTAGAGGGFGFGGSTNLGDGGGGGGGYYGGGTLSSGTIGSDTQGGGGGSGFIGGVINGTLIAGDATMPNPAGSTMTGNSGNGLIRFTYIPIGTSVTAVASPTSICNGNSANLTASNVVTYTWLPSGSFSGSNLSNVSVSPSSNQSYTVQGTNSNGCISQAVLTVTVSTGSPILTVNTSTNSICLGKTVTLTASGALTYSWSGGVTNGVSFAPSSTSNYTVIGQNGCGTASFVTSVSVAALPVTTMATPTIVCAGSTATLMAGSSVPGYTWQPLSIVGQSVLVSPVVNTIYTVTASDGTCSGTATVAVNTKPIPTLSLVVSNSLVCEGNAVTFSASGATSYTWNPGNQTGSTFTANPLSATLYSVVGENTVNCTSNLSQVVIVNPNPVVTVASSKTMVCVGGSVSLTASGANTYSWNTGSQTNVNIQNPTSTTIYSVVGTFTGTQCFTTKTVSVIVFAPQITVSSPTSICVGSSATLTASGGNPGGYAWSNGLNFQTIVVTPTVQTTYICTAPSTSNNLTCSSSASTQVSLNPLPIINVAATKTVMCRKDAGAVLTATGGLTYVWSTGAITSTITALSTVATTSNYIVTGTDANGCKNTKTIAIKVDVCQAINEWESEVNNFIVYPNPSNGNFEVKSESELQLKLINELGQVIQLIELTSQTNYSAKLNDVSAGVYFLVGQNKNGHVKQKVIVSK